MKTLKHVFEEHLDVASDAAMTDALCIMSNFVEDMRSHHPKEVEEMLVEVDEVLSPYLSHEEAVEIVTSFENKDGSKGEHWTVEQTKDVARKYNVDLEGKNFKCYDWYAVMNMVYSDYYHSNWNLDVYVEIAKDFLYDKDFDKPGKAKWYFMQKHKYVDRH